MSARFRDVAKTAISDVFLVVSIDMDGRRTVVSRHESLVGADCALRMLRSRNGQTFAIDAPVGKLFDFSGGAVHA